MFPEGNLIPLSLKRTISQCTQISSNFQNLLNLATKDRKEVYVHCFLPNADFLLQDKQLRRIDSVESSGSDKQVATINFDILYFANQLHSRQLFNYFKLVKYGYCHRFLFQEFYKRYNLILQTDSIAYHKNILEIYMQEMMSTNQLCSDSMYADDTGLINAICKILVEVDVQPCEINFGSDYLFIKQFQTLFKLERIRLNRITYFVILIQRSFRCWLFRRRFVLYRQSQCIIARNYLLYRVSYFICLFRTVLHLIKKRKHRIFIASFSLIKSLDDLWTNLIL